MMLFLCATYLVAQEQNASLSEAAKLEKLKGTFTIVTYHRAYEVPSNLSEIIEKNRLADKQNIVELSQGVSLVIYPATQLTLKEQKGKQ